MSLGPQVIINTADSEDYKKRYFAARERAQWELGDSSWADVIINAFLYPEEDAESLTIEQE